MRPHYSEQWLKDYQNVARKHAVRGGLKASSNLALSPFFSYKLSLTGQVPSGKNQVQLLWRNGKVRRYPNKTFTNWRVSALCQLLEQTRPALPLSEPISLTCDYCPGNLIVRDVSGQLDAVFSLLVHAKILTNDGLIYSVLWRRHDLSRKFPQLVMEVTPWT